ncbi:hypothetical protein FUA48_02570 [Flavobacterium alkalisoli]|uniref:DUF2019 domain-containing protein n=1 Tax=Flavobacterium alkalisoli TaxID=2602769 RepID=A0A5B9FNV9_9FLAO|nr:hypothetical protein [Flavobacterium alkalisoli]QEE48495.1 hypothetical protein FUA48_02570 [Flavobacterium alkalisoli]
MDLDSALQQFEKAAELHAYYNERYEFKKGNIHADAVMEAVNFLKSIDGLSHLEQFLDSDSMGIKGWAAAYLLTLNNQKAIDVLENTIALNIPHYSFNAKILLSEWREGNLKL